MGKKCFVPHCQTGYEKPGVKHKYRIHGIPRNPIIMERWQEAIAREDKDLTENYGVCSKHFRDTDYEWSLTYEKYKQKLTSLKPDAVPSIFPEQPESVSGYVRKRRRIEAYSDEYHKKLAEKWRNLDVQDNGKNTELLKTENNNEEENEIFPESNIIKEEIIIKSEITLNDNITSEVEETLQSTHMHKKKLKVGLVKMTHKKLLQKVSQNCDTEAVMNEKKDWICEKCQFVGKSFKGIAIHKGKAHSSCDDKKSDKKMFISNEKVDTETSEEENESNKYEMIEKFIDKDKKLEKKIITNDHQNKDDNIKMSTKERTSESTELESNTNENLSEEMIVETAESVFICKQCPFVGDTLKSLSLHTIRFHNIGHFPPRKTRKVGKKCNKCGYLSKSKTDFMKHLLEHTVQEMSSKQFEKVENNVDNLKCKNCRFECVSKNDLVAHNMLEHGSFI